MVSNNSSGMCCGVSQNTYHTLRDMRVVFADGTMLDTADPDSRAAFLDVRSPTRTSMWSVASLQRCQSAWRCARAWAIAGGAGAGQPTLLHQHLSTGSVS